MMRNSKKINRFRWKGSCSTVSSFLYKFKLLKTQLRVHVYVAHYVIFLYVACREIGSLHSFFYKNIFYKNIEAKICEILRIF